MHPNRRTGVPLLLFGGLTLLLVVSWLPRSPLQTFGQAAVASVAVAIGASTLIATGGAWLAGDAVSRTFRTRLPALGLMFLGTTVIAGTGLIFATRTPTEPSGLFAAAGALVVTVMAGVLFQGYHWARTATAGAPLALTIGMVNVGLFHRFAQQHDPQLPVTAVAAIVLVLGFGPVVVERTDVSLAVFA